MYSAFARFTRSLAHIWTKTDQFQLVKLVFTGKSRSRTQLPTSRSFYNNIINIIVFAFNGLLNKHVWSSRRQLITKNNNTHLFIIDP